jgi:hypothetical protein
MKKVERGGSQAYHPIYYRKGKQEDCSPGWPGQKKQNPISKKEKKKSEQKRAGGLAQAE